MLAVIGLSMLATFVVATLVATAVDQESAADAEMLGDLRGLWAMQGMIDYAVSRSAYRSASADGLCDADDTASGDVAPCSNDAERATQIATLLSERATSGGGDWEWTYPGYPAGAYRLTTGVYTLADEDSQADNGYLHLALRVTGQGTLPGLPGFVDRVGLLSVDFCVNATSPCAEGATVTVDDTAGTASFYAVQRERIVNFN